MDMDDDTENGVVFPIPEDSEKVVVKFKKESGIRYTGAEFASVTGTEVNELTNLLNKFPNIAITRTFDESDETLEEQAALVAPQLEGDAPALSGYYHINTKDLNEAEKLCCELKKNRTVENVYIEPAAVPALFDTPEEKMEVIEQTPSTANFVAQQGYLNAAPSGVDARYAWARRGGKGENIRIIDIEGAWRFNHEDLRLNQGGIVGGSPTSNISWENHGTAVIGEISGDENNFGIVGISPKATMSAVSIFGSGYSSAKAIKTAADRLRRGDIILIELHRPGPGASGRGQDGFIPIEWWQADFEAVRYATGRGVIVIAAAGNGSRNLDDPIYRRRFDRSVRDSGAILVGAGAPPSGHYGNDRSRLGFSNWGAIVDAQGWGREVVTAGYGDLQGGPDRNKWYTSKFSGTSSASPIVVGAVACLLGALKASGRATMTYSQIRTALRTTGTAQTDTDNRPRTQRIGNRPDLRQLIQRYVPTPVTTTRLYRYWNPTTTDHFYTTNFRELGRGRMGYRYEGVQCYVLTRRTRYAVPLYRYWNPTNSNHFYTTNFRELGRGRLGYRYEGVQCYVYRRRLRYDMAPLYRYWNRRIGDHFYTTNFHELGRGRYGYRYEGVQCWVLRRPISRPPEMGAEEEEHDIESSELLSPEGEGEDGFSDELDYPIDTFNYDEDSLSAKGEEIDESDVGDLEDIEDVEDVEDVDHFGMISDDSFSTSDTDHEDDLNIEEAFSVEIPDKSSSTKSLTININLKS